MGTICGVDGCRGGWVAVSKDLNSGRVSWRMHESIEALASQVPEYELIAIDIPIGLPDTGPRLCDLEARKLLGARGSSVFPAPVRAVLNATSPDEASAIRYRLEGKKMSRQAFGILPKIKQVDDALRMDIGLRSQLREVHPEVCFYFLADGKPMQHSKKTAEGRAERLALLTPTFGESVSQALMERRALQSGVDDVLDAFAALWTAERITNGTCASVPSEPVRDAFGLRMEIVA